MTSHDVVAKMRKLLKQRRVGHAGTLDPAASGVLPICAGQATRVAEYLSESGKAYRATIVFGVETDTYDAEGQITRTASTEDLNQARIEEVLAQFRGPQMQIPPRYSAIKIQGQAADKRTRAGEELVLAYDLGQALGCGAHLGGLIRTRSGPFRLAESITLEDLATASEQGYLANHAQPADRALEQYPALHLNAEDAARVKHGNLFTCDSAPGERSLARVYNPAGEFIAIAEREPQGEKWQPKKVFGE
jgi:tRNA pseudouridine55 synthase